MSKSIYGEYKAEIIEKKSKFIAIAKNISSEEDAKKFISAQRKIYYDARHVVYAYILSSNEKKYSDDGEPSKTAGLPILKILEHEKLVYSLILVIRYFGGILLGTGGLARAYSCVAKKVLSDNKIKIIENQMHEKIILNVKYDYIDKINRELEKNNCFILKRLYDSDIKIIFCVLEKDANKILNILAQFNNSCIVQSRDKVFGAVVDIKDKKDKKFVCYGE